MSNDVNFNNIVANYGFEFSTATNSNPQLTKGAKCFQYTLIATNLLFFVTKTYDTKLHTYNNAANCSVKSRM